MRRILIAVLFCGACAANPTSQAQQPATMPSANPAAAAPSDAEQTPRTDDLLDAMERAGNQMSTLTAKVKMASVDAGTGSDSQRNGTIWLQRLPDGDTRARVRFNDRISRKRKFNERTEFLLADDWVVQRDYKDPADPQGKNKETLRQVRRPGEKTDLLKLGEGPFPLPIGQPRERVKSQFQVTRLPNDPQRAGLAVIELRPLESNRLSERFETVTVWVDPADAIPRVIETVDRNGSTINTTTLSEVQLNGGVGDADFKLEPIKDQEWEITRVPLDK